MTGPYLVFHIGWPVQCQPGTVRHGAALVPGREVTMVSILITILIYALVFCLIYWLITLIPLPEPFAMVVRVILAIIAVILIINLLLPLAHGPGYVCRGLLC
jgi:hypothetical protein